LGGRPRPCPHVDEGRPERPVGGGPLIVADGLILSSNVISHPPADPEGVSGRLAQSGASAAAATGVRPPAIRRVLRRRGGPGVSLRIRQSPGCVPGGLRDGLVAVLSASPRPAPRMRNEIRTKRWEVAGPAAHPGLFAINTAGGGFPPAHADQVTRILHALRPTKLRTAVLSSLANLRNIVPVRNAAAAGRPGWLL
jgi:hypothetical protein